MMVRKNGLDAIGDVAGAIGLVTVLAIVLVVVGWLLVKLWIWIFEP
jgi:hypothetical protein